MAIGSSWIIMAMALFERKNDLNKGEPDIWTEELQFPLVFASNEFQIVPIRSPKLSAHPSH